MGRLITPEDPEHAIITADWQSAGSIPVFASHGVYYRRVAETDSFAEIDHRPERSMFGTEMPRLYGNYPPEVNDDDVAAGDFPKRW
jgi:hypothetical protein